MNSSKTITCILCPVGCGIEAVAENGRIVRTEGNACKKGKEYAEQEICRPMRNIASSVLVLGGELPLASVRLTAPIPKALIMQVMAEIKRLRLEAPVHSGQIVIQNVLGLGCDVIATKTVERFTFISALPR